MHICFYVPFIAYNRRKFINKIVSDDCIDQIGLPLYCTVYYGVLAEVLPSIVDHLFLVVHIQVDMELLSIFFLLLIDMGVIMVHVTNQ
jgi:hypothetical protein